jgi:hypothetical protein
LLKNKCYTHDGSYIQARKVIELLVDFAEEGGVIWHDLRKNPKDLPEDKEFKITDKGNIGFYDSCWKKWYYWNSNEMIFPPIAWCELPKFEE